MNVLFNYNGSVESNLESVKKFLQSVLDKLDSHIEDEDSFFDIKLILNELVVNGVVHGNKGNTEKKVYLDVTLDEKGITINVKDEGKGIDYDVSSYNVDEMKCSGRGLLLVEALSDNLILKSNEIIVVKYL